jgi:hypothetical protein
MHEGAIRFGVALVLIGVASTVLVAISHRSAVGKLRAGEMPLPTMWPLSITISLLLALLALGGLWRFTGRVLNRDCACDLRAGLR